MSSIGVGAGGAAAAEEEPEPEDAAAVAAAAEEAAAEEAATARRRREGAAIYLFVSILFRSMSSEQTRARPGSLRERAKEKEKEKEKEKRGGGVKRPRGVEGKARVVFLCSSSKKNQWRFRHS